MNIESINNSKVKAWAKLKEKKYRDSEQSFIIEGDHLLKEALKKGLVKEIIALDDIYKIEDIPFYLVTKEIMKKLTSQVTISPVIAVVNKIDPRDINGRVCLLDNIQDPGNLGTIIRSAVAFNIDTIILSPDTVDLYNEKVIRASEGMIFNLNFVKKDLKLSIEDLKKDNYQIIGTNVQKGELLKNISFSAKTGIIMGNEGRGMNQSLLDYCDNLAYIPISNSCESLNVAIAASIIFYEINR